jgi:hypothetical protein
MSPLDAQAFLGHCRQLTALCPSLPFRKPAQVDYCEATSAASVEELERIRDAFLAVGVPRPPAGFQLGVPRSRPGTMGHDWSPCASWERWAVELARAVNDCVADHKALQVRACALARELEEARQKAKKRTVGGQNGWRGYRDFEAGLRKEVNRLRDKALAAQARFQCFLYQIAQFGEPGAKAEVRPEGGADAGPREEPERVAPAGGTETEAGPAATATAEGGNPPAPIPPNLFARLPGNRYRIAFGGKEETVPSLVGLRVVEFLLKQPGKPAHVLDINRALSEGLPRAADIEDAFARSEEEKGLAGFTTDASRQPDPCSKEDLEEVKEALKSLEEQAEKARDGGEHDKADKLERSADTARKWIKEQETLGARKRRGQPDRDAQIEKARVRLKNNFTNACEKLRTEWGLRDLADHLVAQIDSRTEWKYRPVPGVDWAFDPEAPLNQI